MAKNYINTELLSQANNSPMLDYTLSIKITWLVLKINNYTAITQNCMGANTTQLAKITHPVWVKTTHLGVWPHMSSPARISFHENYWEFFTNFTSRSRPQTTSFPLSILKNIEKVKRLVFIISLLEKRVKALCFCSYLSRKESETNSVVT